MPESNRPTTLPGRAPRGVSGTLITLVVGAVGAARGCASHPAADLAGSTPSTRLAVDPTAPVVTTPGPERHGSGLA